MTESGNALVLSAGGILGAFQAGAISKILTKDELVPNGIFGSSAGAINGAFLADRAGRQMSTEGKVRWAEIGRQLIEFWERRITGPDVLWRARDYADIGWDLLWDNFRGLLETKGYRDIVRSEIDRNNFTMAPVNYHPGTVDLFSGKIEYPDKSDQSIVDYVIASSAIPIAMDFVEIDNVPFVDGGTRDVAPLSRAVEENYTKVICIVCQSEQLTSRTFPPRKLSRLFSRLMSIIINETVNNDLKTIDRYKRLFQQHGLTRADLGQPLNSYNLLQEVRIIRPRSELDYDDMNFDSDDIKEMIKLGSDAASDSLDNVLPSFKELLDSDISGSFTIRW
jgi:NTE family protein